MQESAISFSPALLLICNSRRVVGRPISRIKSARASTPARPKNLVAFACRVNAPNIDCKAHEFGKSLLVNAAVIDRMNHRKSLSMIAVGVSAKLMLDFMTLEVAGFPPA